MSGPSLGTATLRAVLDAGSLKASLQVVRGDIEGFAKDASKQFQSVGRGMTTAGKAATVGLTLPILAAGTAILKFSGDFERGMNRVAALSGAAGQEFEKLRDQAKDLGATTQFSATQAADAMAFLAQAGFKANQIFAAMPATLNLAGAAQLDLGQSADIVSNILTGFQLPVDQLDRAVDVLTKSFTSANTDLSQLGQGFKFVGPVASSFGLSLEETAAALGLLSNAGIQAGSAGTGLRRILTTLATEQDKLGISTFDAQGKLRPLGDIFEDLADRALTATEVMEIFGDRGGPALNALLSQGSVALRQLTTDLQDSAGSAKRIQEVQLQGLVGELIQLKSAAEGLAIAFGDAGLLGSSTGLVQGATRMVRAFTELDPALQKIITGAAGFLAILGPTLVVTGSLIRNVGTIIGILPKLAAGLAVVRTAGLLFAGPAGWVAAGAIAVVSLTAALAGTGKKTLEGAATAAAAALETNNADVVIDALEDMRDSVNTTAIPALDSLIAKLQETGLVTVEVAEQVNAFAAQADRAQALVAERARLTADLAQAEATLANLRSQQPVVDEALAARRAQLEVESPALAARMVEQGFFQEAPELTGALRTAEQTVARIRADLESLPNPSINLTPLPERDVPDPDDDDDDDDDAVVPVGESPVAQRLGILRTELRALQAEVDMGLEDAGTLAERKVEVVDTAVRDLIRLGAGANILEDLLGDRAGFEQEVRDRAAFIAPIMRAELLDAAIAADRAAVEQAQEQAAESREARDRREERERARRAFEAPILQAAALDEAIASERDEIDAMMDEAAADRVRRQNRERVAAARRAYEAPILAAQAFDEALAEERDEIDALQDRLAAERLMRDNRAAAAMRRRIAELQAQSEGTPAFLPEGVQREAFVNQKVELATDTLSALIAQEAPVGELYTAMERLRTVTGLTSAPAERLSDALVNVFGVAPDAAAAILDVAERLAEMQATAEGFVGRVDTQRLEEDALQSQWTDYDPDAYVPPSPARARTIALQRQLTEQDDSGPVLIAAFRELQSLAPRLADQFSDLARELLAADLAARQVVTSTRDLRMDEDEAQAEWGGTPAGPPPYEPPTISEFDGIGERLRKAAEIGGDTYKSTVIAAANEFAGLVVSSAETLSAIFRGEASAGDAIGGIGGIIGGIVSLFDPLIGGLITIGSQMLGGIFNAFTPGDSQAEQEAERARAATPRGAPSVQLTVNVLQTLNVQSLTNPADRAAVDGLLTDTVRRVESVLTSFGQRLNATEARLNAL